MAFDITVQHPAYQEYRSFWELMRDAYDGEDAVKARGERYLPIKSGIAAIDDATKRSAAYDAYRKRAEFPELVAPTVRGTVGVMLNQAATIELPSALEGLRERATRNGMPIDVLHRMIATEIMTTGRYGILPGISAAGEPYLAGYCAESIINWDVDEDDVPNYVVLDESGLRRDPATGKWEKVDRYLECSALEGSYTAKEWVKGAAGFTPGVDMIALRPPRSGQRGPLGTLPFVFVNTNGLQASPDDVPLYGLAKLSVRIYRMDADYTFALHMTSEPTPYVSGFDNAKEAVKEGLAPRSIGASRLWILPKGATAGFLEFSGAGLRAQKDAIFASLDRAVALGAQVLADRSRTAESGDAIALRLGNQASVLKLVAQNTAQGLEKALRNLAVWVGADPKQVKVTPNLDFFDETISGADITALVGGWQKGAYSWKTTFERLQKGGVIPTDRTPEDEQELIAEDDAKRGATPDQTELFDPVTGAPIKPAVLPPQIAGAGQ